MKAYSGPTGQLVKGDVLDCNKDRLESAVKNYDPQLYIKWNPFKRAGYGMWELRRLPNEKSIVDTIQLNGITIHRLEYREVDIENHIFNLPTLGYDLLDRLKKTDTWTYSSYEVGKQHRVENFTKKMDETYYSNKEAEENKAREDLIYKLKNSGIGVLQQRIKDGFNPAEIMRYWK